MTKNERINRDLQRLKDTGRLVLYDPEVWRLVIDTLPSGRYEVSIDHGDDLGPDVVIASWSAVVYEVTSFYTALTWASIMARSAPTTNLLEGLDQ